MENRKRKHDLESYTIERTEQVVKVGDQVLLKSPKPHDPPYVACVDKLESINKRNGKVEVKARIQWYYRPEDTSEGRKDYHGTKELFLSDHYDDESVDCIIGKCTVHSFKDYVKLANVGDEDYYSRYKYNARTAELILHDLDGSCQYCGLLYNPDHNPSEKAMLQCKSCKLRYHPACIHMSIAIARKTCIYYCAKCDEPPSGPDWRTFVAQVAEERQRVQGRRPEGQDEK